MLAFADCLISSTSKRLTFQTWGKASSCYCPVAMLSHARSLARGRALPLVLALSLSISLSFSPPLSISLSPSLPSSSPFSSSVSLSLCLSRFVSLALSLTFSLARAPSRVRAHSLLLFLCPSRLTLFLPPIPLARMSLVDQKKTEKLLEPPPGAQYTRALIPPLFLALKVLRLHFWRLWVPRFLFLCQSVSPSCSLLPTPDPL